MADFNGDVTVRFGGKERITLVGKEGDIRVTNAAGDLRFHFDGKYAALYLGGPGNEGDLIVRDGANKERIKLDGGEGRICVKDAAGEERVRLDGEGNIVVKDAAGNVQLQFYSNKGALYLGTRPRNESPGIDLSLFRDRIKLDGAEGVISVKDEGGSQAFLIDGNNLFAGGKDAGGGSVIVRDNENKTRIQLNGHDGRIWVKAWNSNNNAVEIGAEAILYLGCEGRDGALVVRDNENKQRIKLDGSEGDIILSNADAAEDFDVANAAEVAAGMVMVLEPDGTLTPCSSAYDQTVVGVVSGADRYKPGIVFDRGEKADDRRVPISVMGKVACRVDADYGSIRAGDLLTTSPSSGFAMKAVDPARAFGAIIGKALHRLDDGAGLVPMLISLQ